MKEQTNITEKELIMLQILESILTKYDIPKESYTIGKNNQNNTKTTICLTKVSAEGWSTYLKLHNSLFDSIYHSNLTYAIVKLIQYLAPDEEQYILMLQEFLNSLNINHQKKDTKIKYYRKKR